MSLGGRVNRIINTDKGTIGKEDLIEGVEYIRNHCNYSNANMYVSRIPQKLNVVDGKLN